MPKQVLGVWRLAPQFYFFSSQRNRDHSAESSTSMNSSGSRTRPVCATSLPMVEEPE